VTAQRLTARYGASPSVPQTSPRALVAAKLSGCPQARFELKLYTFFRSSAAFRVRIALNLKNVAYDEAFVHLSKDGGQNRKPEYRAINPQMKVPTLILDNGERLIQSLAIIEYLDETHPEPPLLPNDPLARAKARAVAQIIACDIHPIDNTAPLRYLKNELKQEQPAIDAWYHHWILEAFPAIEQMISPGPYCFGDRPTVADICLVPQVFNARRFKVPLERFPKIVSVETVCLKQPAFDKARPENQRDAE
jgi:maleylpyruvate isomerase